MNIKNKRENTQRWKKRVSERERHSHFKTRVTSRGIIVPNSYGCQAPVDLAMSVSIKWWSTSLTGVEKLTGGEKDSE